MDTSSMRQWCDACLGPCAYSREHANQINVYTLMLSPEKGPRSRLELLRPHSFSGHISFNSEQ